MTPEELENAEEGTFLGVVFYAPSLKMTLGVMLIRKSGNWYVLNNTLGTPGPYSSELVCMSYSREQKMQWALY